MWQVINRTPFAAHGYPLRDVDGTEHWGIAVRATFNLSNGDLPTLSAEQVPIALVPSYDETGEELLEEADLLPFRPACDVLILGIAQPPSGHAVASFPVRLTVGPIDKTVICWGPRHATPDGRVTQDGAAEAMPLTWRMAAGGVDATGDTLHPDNPIGIGWTSAKDRLESKTKTTLPRLTITGESDPFDLRPAGFGGLAPHWRPRRKWAGTYDNVWERRRAPRYPTDFDLRFHHAAPLDQVADLKGG